MYLDRAMLVDLDTLENALKEHSTDNKRFWVEGMTSRKVTIGFNNPDKSGKENPVFISYPYYARKDFNIFRAIIVLDITENNECECFDWILDYFKQKYLSGIKQQNMSDEVAERGYMV